MTYRNFYFNILVRILSILLLSVLSGFMMASGSSIPLLLLCLAADVLIILSLVSYINQTNKKIAFFFDAVRNDDSSLTFPAESGNRSLKDLYRSMNRVNDQIQQLKIENRQQEQYFSILLDHLGTGIITFDSKGFVLNSNNAARTLLGTDILTHIKQLERVDRRLFNAISEMGPSQRRLVSFESQDEELQLALKATTFKKGDENLTIVSLQDIRSELEEKELDSWLKLIRVLMHEIMNSITPITSLSETLLNMYVANGSPLPPGEITGEKVARTLQGLAIIRERGKGLMSFVESYRKLTKIPEPEKKSFSIADLLSRIKVLYRSLDGSEGIDLLIAPVNIEHEVLADENLLSQVLINLLKNAIEANRDNPSAKIIISVTRPDGNHSEISVSDNGPGIPEENLDKIFVPFFTTREDGSGIGLSISKQIMRVHGGNLKVKSVPGRETTFTVTV